MGRAAVLLVSATSLTLASFIGARTAARATSVPRSARRLGQARSVDEWRADILKAALVMRSVAVVLFGLGVAFAIAEVV